MNSKDNNKKYSSTSQGNIALNPTDRHFQVQLPIKKSVEDNGPKWGSNVKQNSDQSFPYDAKMKNERPAEWMKMINERTSWLNRNSKYDYSTGKMYPRITATSKKYLHVPEKNNPSTSKGPENKNFYPTTSTASTSKGFENKNHPLTSKK